MFAGLPSRKQNVVLHTKRPTVHFELGGGLLVTCLNSAAVERLGQTYMILLDLTGQVRVRPEFLKIKNCIFGSILSHFT